MDIKLKFGDTLSGLAAKFKTSVQKLAQANGIADPNRIFAGKTFRIPSDKLEAGNGAERYQSYKGYSNEAVPPLPANFPFGLDADGISKAIGVSKANVQRFWPHIAQSLDEAGIRDPNAIIAVLATIKTEVFDFAPIPEFGGGRQYEGRRDLGNTQPGDGERFKGRGFIQLTGRANYREYGEKLGLDLEHNPDLALDPKVSSQILVQYFKDRGIANMASNGDWKAVRKAVNGGLNGYDTFLQAVSALSKASV